MTKISKLSFIGAVLAVSIASPAFAEFLETGTASNNAGFYSVDPAPQQPTMAVRHVGHVKTAHRQHGLNSFALVPGGAFEGSSNSPASTGGGSFGYNQNLNIDN
jgi:hypothetical protein